MGNQKLNRSFRTEKKQARATFHHRNAVLAVSAQQTKWSYEPVALANSMSDTNLIVGFQPPAPTDMSEKTGQMEDTGFWERVYLRQLHQSFSWELSQRTSRPATS